MPDITLLERLLGSYGLATALVAFGLMVGWRLGHALLRRADEAFRGHMALLESTTKLITRLQEHIERHDGELRETRKAIQDHTSAIASNTNTIVSFLAKAAQ